mgnify:CR=1 FL=1
MRHAVARAVPRVKAMTNSRNTPALSHGARALTACTFGLAACLAVHPAWAQGATWDEFIAHDAGPDYEHRTEGRALARPNDPDLVREGAFPSWRATLAAGATAVENAALDLDGDGVVERLLTVRPCADPYPYNEASGLVLVRHAPDGFRATVLLRDGDGPTWHATVWRGSPLVTLVWTWTEGHASEGFYAYEARYRFRLGRDGVLRHVETCLRGAEDGHPFPAWGRRVSAGGGYSEQRCR